MVGYPSLLGLSQAVKNPEKPLYPKSSKRSIHISPVHTTTGCGEQGFPSAQPYLSHTPVS